MNVMSRLLLSFPKLAAMLRDRSGVAAVEFAFVAPVLLCMYFITMEASQGLEVSRRVSRIGSTVADLITQQSAVNRAQVRAIMQIGGAIIQPYNRSRPALEVTAIELGTQTTPVARVVWSARLDSSGNVVKVLNKGDIVTDAQLDRIRAPGAFYIRVTSRLDYQPVITWAADASSVGLLSAFNDINMAETFYLRPRVSTRIPCGDCP